LKINYFRSPDLRNIINYGGNQRFDFPKLVNVLAISCWQSTAKYV